MKRRDDLSRPRGGIGFGIYYDPEAFGRFSEAIARFLGTARFLVYMTAFVAIWIIWNLAAPGSLRFDVDGRVCRLEAFQEPDEVELFVVFGDSTNGSGTFGGGRYLYAKPADDRGRVVLDFNRAYNPPCVFTEHATCVLPLKVNRLPVAIEAGEKRYGRH